jgi:hypothetical protein
VEEARNREQFAQVWGKNCDAADATVMLAED